MNAETDTEPFRQLMAGVFALYGRELSDTVLSIWWEALRSFDLVAVREALSRHAMNPDAGQFLPKPADVVRELHGTRGDAAALAWAKTIGAVRDHGSWRSVAFDDPIIHRVVEDLGGWTWLCAQRPDEMSFVERRFRDAYRAWRARGDVPPHRLRLAGVIELTNAANGHPAPDLVLVGNASGTAAVSVAKPVLALPIVGRDG